MIEIEAAKASNFHHKHDSVLDFVPCLLIIYRYCTLHWLRAARHSVADLKGLRTFTTFFIIFPSLPVILFFSIWCCIKESRASRRDSLITWGGDQTVWRTLKTKLSQPSLTTVPNRFFQDWEKRGCFHLPGNIAKNSYVPQCLYSF